MANNKQTLKKYKKFKKTFFKLFPKKTKTKNKIKNKTKTKTKNKAKGKSVKGNRQLTNWLKQQGSLTYKFEGKSIELKLNDEIVNKIDKIIKDEYKEQVKKRLIDSLQPAKKALNILLKHYPTESDEFSDKLKNIEIVEEYSLEKFTKEKIKDTEEEVNEILEDVLYNLDIGISNETMAESEIEGYHSNNLDTYIKLKKDLLINVKNYYPLGQY